MLAKMEAALQQPILDEREKSRTPSPKETRRVKRTNSEEEESEDDARYVLKLPFGENDLYGHKHCFFMFIGGNLQRKVVKRKTRQVRTVKIGKSPRKRRRNVAEVPQVPVLTKLPLLKAS